MAYTNVQSGEIPEGTQYYSGKLPLGDYDFYLSIDATGVSPKIVSKCVSPDGETRTAASRTWPAGTQVRGWSIEANETEASVYAVIKNNTKPLDTGSWPWPAPTGTSGYVVNSQQSPLWKHLYSCDNCIFTGGFPSKNTATFIAASASPGAKVIDEILYNGRYYSTETYNLTSSYTYNGKTVYYAVPYNSVSNDPEVAAPGTWGEEFGYNFSYANIAWNMIYAQEYGEEKETLIGRFAIDLHEAGGEPGGGWTQPGDWNPDPTTTLHLLVNGALSGRHNDPLNDTSFSYVPADNTAQAGYGCGGDGGHGGGGGAGASTIIVRQFATNKANSKDVIALAKRHGYGSGGGKGAKGGDGCILIYY